MPSVTVAWKGRCHEPHTRYRLLGYLHRLAAASDQYLRPPGPARPVIVKIPAGEREAPPCLSANIETIDQPIAGHILVSTGVSLHPEMLAARAREEGLSLMDAPGGEGLPLIAIESAHLRGLDFKLFDPRGLHPGSDRMSFVFLECPEHPFLHGRLVEVQARSDGEAGGMKLPGGTVRLSSPSIHLSDYLEDWTDCLFSWMRFFFIGDLWWHRREELQGYDDYRGVFKQVQSDRGGAAAEEATFEAVLATFRQHAEHWIGEVEGWANQEKGHG